MNKLLKAVLFPTCVGVLALYGANISALTERQTFEVSVSIPTVDFHVLPVNPQLLIQQQELEWDVSRKDLRPLVTYFDVRSSASAVNAYLETVPVMDNGNSTFGLTVRFNGKTLSPLTIGAVEVLDEREANIGKRVRLEIIPIRPGSGYNPGIYYGNVRMIFDAVIGAGA